MDAYKTACAFLLAVLQLAAGAPGRASSDSDVLRFKLPVEPTVDPERTCKAQANLTPTQMAICQKQPQATAAALEGVAVAVVECQRQMAGQRWNCSELRDRAVSSHPIVRRGFRESAFTQAILAAGIAHQVATSCASGSVKTCGCDNSERPSDGGWQWGGCSHNVNFGAKFSRRFLQDKGSDLYATVSAHNTKIGRKVVNENLATKCKCLGMSSSCELKTCWMTVPDFSIVGKQLFTLFNEAVMVDSTNDVAGRVTPRPVQPPSFSRTVVTAEQLSKSLVYYERSPTFCDADPTLGVSGTTGRPCNTTSDGANGCQKLCCGRGYFTVKVKKSEKCNCRFHWCCNVTCERCNNSTWITVCK